MLYIFLSRFVEKCNAEIEMRLILSNMVSFTCVGGAIALALNGFDGWGWFLVVAYLCSCSYK